MTYYVDGRHTKNTIQALLRGEKKKKKKKKKKKVLLTVTTWKEQLSSISQLSNNYTTNYKHFNIF